MPCLTSSILWTLKILIPCEKEKIIDDKVPPILSFVSYFPEIWFINFFLEVPINIGKPREWNKEILALME